MKARRTNSIVSRVLLFMITGVLLWPASPPMAWEQAQASGAIVFEGARLIAGDGSAPIEDSAFIVETGRFTIIGRRGEIKVPPGAVRVDLTGKTVMPAMIDSHGHLGPRRQDYIDQLNLLAYCGIAVTTSMGEKTTDQEMVYAVRNPPNGAQLLTSGLGMVGPLGLVPATLAAGATGRLPEDLRTVAIRVATDEEAREHVLELVGRKVDFIKIWVDSRLGTEVPMKPAVYKAIIDEAHKHNLRVFAHMWFLQDAKDLARAGLDAFAHPIRDQDVDDEFEQLLKNRPNVFIQTNLKSTQFLTLTQDPAWLTDQLLLDISSPERIQRMRGQIQDKTSRTHEGWPTDMSKVAFANQTYGIMKRNTAKLYKAGVPFAVGTDGGGPPQGFDYHVELELLVKDVGLTPAQAITMATQGGARALEIDRHLGTVESGKDASFLVLTANPLDDITNTRRIAQVYLRGRELDRPGFLADWKHRHP
jgi:imidazolonepropionase-like amidohydrolase